jgi:hypothetical protein
MASSVAQLRHSIGCSIRTEDLQRRILRMATNLDHNRTYGPGGAGTKDIAEASPDLSLWISARAETYFKKLIEDGSD